MASILDLSNFTFEGELLTNVNQLAYDKILKAPELNRYVQLYTNIKINKEVGFIGGGSAIGKKNATCTIAAETYSVASRVITWEPTNWLVFVSQCWADLSNTIASYGFKNGVELPDLTASDYMAIVTDKLVEDITAMYFRMVFFGDTDADVIANGGVLTAGTDKTHFNWFDGFFKQMITQCTSNAAQLVTITENAGASYALQALDEDNVQGYLDSAIYGADIKLKQMPNNFIIATQTVFEALEKSLSGVNIESMYFNLTEGVRGLKYRGIPVIPEPMIDSIIDTYENTGTKWNNPHRFIYTNKEILGVGVDATTSFDTLETWYDKKEEKVYTKARGTLDAKLMNPELFVLGYGAIGS
jgi:hypothetical protein